MKKILAFFVAAACAVSAMATNYDGELVVTINGDTTAMGTNITVDKDKTDAGYDLSIKNFKLVAGESVLPVGNIVLTGCEGTDAYGITTIKFNKNVTISAGDDPTVESTGWMGPMLGEVPIAMTAKLNDTVLSVNIDIYMKMLEQSINVGFVGNAPAPAKGDINEDGLLNVGDVSALINMLLK